MFGSFKFNANDYKTEDKNKEAEYAHMQLHNGDSVKFKRVWGGHRFTDIELEKLIAGQEIAIDTDNTSGVIGSLDFLEYNGYEYYGFANWSYDSYTLENAPFPKTWNGYTFTKEEEAILRKGSKLLIMVKSNKTGNDYAINISLKMIDDQDRWGIVPHFEEFNLKGDKFTKKDCLFTPMFRGKLLSHSEVARLRNGEVIAFEGLRQNGSAYTCEINLELDKRRNRWKIISVS